MRANRVSTSEPMVVVGKGMAGSVLSAMFARRGIPVVVIERFEHRLRPQVLDSFDGRLITDVHFKAGVSLFETLHGGMQIKDLERLMDRRNLRHIDSGAIKLYAPYCVTSIDKEACTVTMTHAADASDQTTIPFKHVFFCDGERRRSVDMMADDRIRYQQRPFQPPHAAYALPLLQTADIPLTRMMRLSELSKFMAPGELVAAIKELQYLDDPDEPGKKIMAWDRPYLPDAYIMRHGKRNTKVKINCNFLVEEPDPRRRRLLVKQWGARLLHLMSRYDGRKEGADANRVIPLEAISELAVKNTPQSQAKNRLRLATTSVVLDRIEEPSIPLRADGSRQAVFVGGAAATAWFKAANGAQSAMQSALAAGDCLSAAGEWDGERYKAAMRAITASADMVVAGQSRALADLAMQQMEIYLSYAAGQKRNPRLVCKGYYGLDLLGLMRKYQASGSGIPHYQRAAKGIRQCLNEIRRGKQSIALLRALIKRIKELPVTVSVFSSGTERQNKKALVVELTQLYNKFAADFKRASMPAAPVRGDDELETREVPPAVGEEEAKDEEVIGQAVVGGDDGSIARARSRIFSTPAVPPKPAVEPDKPSSDKIIQKKSRCCVVM